MKKTLFAWITFGFYLTCHSQAIGEPSAVVKFEVENEISLRQLARGSSSVTETSLISYSNGEIAEVLLNRENVGDIYLRRPISYRIRYQMKGGKLYRILQEYFDVSLNELKNENNVVHRGPRINDYFFNNDYTNYSTVYLSASGLATIETKAVVINDFPSQIRTLILKERERINKENKALREQLKTKKDEDIKYKNTWYDLSQAAKPVYDSMITIIRSEIRNYLEKDVMPSFTELTNESYHNGVKKFDNIYKMEFKKLDKSRETVVSKNVVVAGSNEIYTTKNCSLISGADKYAEFCNKFYVDLPFLIVDGKKCLTELTIDSANIQFRRGVTIIKVNKDKIIYKKYEPQNDEIKATIEKQLQGKKGTFIAFYEYGNLIGEQIIDVKVELSTRENSGNLFSLF